MTPPLHETLSLLVSSLCMGALVGLVRQWADRSESNNNTAENDSAGLRTYAIWSLLGSLSVYSEQHFHSGIFPLTLGLFGGFLIVAFAIDHWRHATLGLTSFSIAMATFLNGGLVMWGEGRTALAISAFLCLLISAKHATHTFTQKLKQEDLRIAIQFLVVSGIILPLVPDKGFGPAEAINLYKVWWMVVLISGLGFVGYVGMRLLGAKAGVLMTGVAGGVASSTATTLALSRTSREYPMLSKELGVGILIACTIMFFRVWLIVFALQRELAEILVIPFAIMAIPSALILVFQGFASKRKKEIAIPEITNPLTLSIAIKFALLYAGVVLLVTLSQQWSMNHGVYLIAFLSGLTDMDAITLSMIDMVKLESVALQIAARSIIVGAVANTIFKGVFACLIGDRRIRPVLLAGMGAMVAGGLLSWTLV
jgi:uncharacterized membrane protein (DUF4010 family)